MTITQHLARAAIRLLSRLAEPEPPEEPDDADELPFGHPTPAMRAEMRAMAIARQARHPYRGIHTPPPQPREEWDSHMRLGEAPDQPKPKPRKPRTRKP